MIEIPSPSQIFEDRALPPASEWEGSTLLVPIPALLDTYTRAALYGDLYLEVVTLTKQRYHSGTAHADYYLWARNNKPCRIENLCTECKGQGRNIEYRWGQGEWFTCLECGGRGWHYAD